MNRRCFFLTEILLAFTLVSLVIGSLFCALKSHLSANVQIARGRGDILERARMQQRLDTLFSSLAERANLDGEKMPIHLEKEGVAPALHVFFNHGIDPDPKFSGTLSGYLELNEDRDYCFVIRGRQRAEACERREVLLQGVNEVEYAFLFLVESGEFQEKRHWRGTESEPLYGLRIRVGRCNAKNLEFAFWLPTPPRPLLFERAIGINGSAKKMDRDATANSVEKNCVLL